MATRAPSASRMIAPNLDAMGKTLDQRIAEAKARGDKKEVERLTLAAGTQSAGVGLVTGIPDLAIMGYNWATGSNIKDLRSRALEAAGVPTEAPDKENDLVYNLPEYATMAWGLSQLAKAGWKGFKNIRQSKKINEFKKTLPTQQANRFDRFMLNGQGADDPMVIAAFQQMRGDPKYAEFFTTLDKAATKAAIKSMTPQQGARPVTATKQAAKAVEDKVSALKTARNSAGDKSFTKAFALAGDRPLVKADETLKALNKLQADAVTTGSLDSLKFADNIEKLKATFVVAEGATDAKALSVPQFQGLLAEFGKKIGTDDAIVKGLSQTDLEKLNKAIFVSLQKDLRSSLVNLPDASDRQAIGALIKARDEFAVNSTRYNNVISQGIPKFLQDKPINELTPEKLYSEYAKLNKGNRSIFRDWVGEKSPSALQFIDKQAYDNFLSKSYGKLADGTMGYDLGKLARNWETLKPNDKDMLVKALGTNAEEFSGRMKDALVFTRKMELGAPTPKPQSEVMGALQRTTKGAVGATFGYPAAQGTDVTLQTGAAVFAKKGLSPDQIMKALLTPEGAEFLKKAAISPRSRETLEALTKMEAVLPTGRAWAAISASQDAIAGAAAGVADMSRGILDSFEEDVFIPDDIAIPEGMESMDAKMDDDIFIPDDLMMPEAAPEPQAAWDVAPEEEQQVMSVLQGMSASDPSLNVDYLMNAYRQADPTKRQQFMSLYGAQR
jgi:hypothetical protein